MNYERCSGQSIKFQKSGALYSSYVRRDKQLEISEILDVHNEITSTKYLGLPSLVGRSKKRVFGYLKEEAGKRIQKWQANPMSQAGKTVLIRNVAHPIPSYSMSYFLIPKLLSQELEHVFNYYCWRSGVANSQKGLNWLSWKNMSVAKIKGGMSFRNLYGFNIALFGKHENFMLKTNTLVSRVFKAKYFPDSRVLNAVKGHNSSFIWTCIFIVKKELTDGFRWILRSSFGWLQMASDVEVASTDCWRKSVLEFLMR